MAVPVLRQATPTDNSVAYSTARTLTFPSPVLLNSTIVVCGVIGFPGATTFSTITSSVTMTGATFARRGEVTFPGGPDRGTMVWSASVTTAGATAVTVTPGNAVADNYCGLIALELTGVSTAVTAWEGYVGAAAGGVNSLAIGPMPASGSLSQADTMAIVVTGLNMGGGVATDQGWTVPAGWTTITSQGSPSGAKMPFYAALKTAASQNAVSVTTNATQADLYGRSGILFVIRGDVGSSPAPTPPPPGPAPPPPPPAAAQAVKIVGVQNEVAGLTGVLVQVFDPPGDEAIVGTYRFSDEDVAFEVALENGDAVMFIPIPGGVTIATGEPVVVIGQKADGTGGFRGAVDGEVVEV